MAKPSEEQWTINNLSASVTAFNAQSAGYLRWREDRLASQQNAQSTVAMLTPTLSGPEDGLNLVTLCDQVTSHGFGVYQWSEPSEDVSRDVLQLHSQLSLFHNDQGVVQQSNGLSLLKDLSNTDQGRFIPYTPRAMGWHTDGYYNPHDQSVRCFTLHCLQPAVEGGGLSLVDDQLVIISMNDEAPDLVELLSHSKAMMIPGNTDELGHDRPDCHSAVIVNNEDGTPAARFTTRTKHIQWRNEATKEAAEYMKQLIEKRTDLQDTVKLQTNQGIVTRNIMHRRDSFTDSQTQTRQMLRGRYLQLPKVTSKFKQRTGAV